ncbi:3-deoxy-D-arabino-heptulosonate 7-phosphate (DAHP) synthase [Enterococcus sp. PF1-24]|uniref:hypothetical protein n=1 Tax=unclassified Enterococcus TaxID=2608891 RepID=UPI002474099A|nr:MULTISPECIES: hypothetical protein [unclassified Enterococcus]MDH6365515.1 3-deoxy-D-arabino-heptulosonate 7-phosphate (DAHP) synthase [Enterococcus sp. PFB1-1]MDH6402616.1 3-deoxy-D-arabino-heptulosonate 7-phosphate (DAHP) synthase [Enterococcus sp. PF1-24]
MKKTTKMTIGLGLVTVAGVSTAVLASSKVLEKIHYTANRNKARKFVNHKFGGNKKVMAVVERLSDEDLEAVLEVADNLKAQKERVEDYGESIKESTGDFKEKVFDYLDDLIG